MGIFEDTSWVLPYRSPWATTIFYSLTQLGNLEVLVLLLPVAYWMTARRFYTRFVLMLIFAVTFDDLLKQVLQDPRPDSANIIGDDYAGTYSFPSNHVVLASAYWGFLAFEIEQWWTTIAACSMIFAVGASRLYLGMHDLDDIPPSFAIGATIAFAFHAQPIDRLAVSYSVRLMLAGAAIAFPLVGLAVFAGLSIDTEVFSAVAFPIGWAAGALWDRTHLSVRPPPVIWHAIVIGLVGTTLTFVSVSALAVVLDRLPLGNSLSLSITLLVVAVWASVIAPALYRSVGRA